eukprot:gene9208-1493_t
MVTGVLKEIEALETRKARTHTVTFTELLLRTGKGFDNGKRQLNSATIDQKSEQKLPNTTSKKQPNSADY